MSEQQKSSRFSNAANTKESSRFSGSSNGKKKVSYQGGYEKGKTNYALAIIGFVLAILPLITTAVVYDPHLSKFDWFSETDSAVDVFLYYKQYWFNRVLILMVIVLCWDIGKKFFIENRSVRECFRFQLIFIPLFLYGILSLLSTILSEHKWFGFNGIFEQFENVWCLVGYVVLVYYIYVYVRTAKDVHTLINVLAVGALIIGLIGTFQGLQMDLFRTDFGRSLIASSDVPAENLVFSFALGRAYVTLYNPNYVGVYCVLIIPIFTVLAAYTKNIKERVLYSSVVLTLLISMFAAQFKAGIVSLAIVAVIMLFFLRRLVIKRWYIVVPLVIVVIGLFIGVDKVNEHVYSQGIKRAFFTEDIADNVEAKKDKVFFHIGKDKFYVTADTVTEKGSTTPNYTAFHVYEEDGTQLEVYLDETQAKFAVRDERFDGFALYPNLVRASFIMELEDQNCNIRLTEDGYVVLPEHPLQNVEVQADRVAITYDEEVYYFKADTTVAEDGTLTYGTIHVFDKDNKELPVYLNEATAKYMVGDVRMGSFAFYPNNVAQTFVVEIDGNDWNFRADPQGYQYYNCYARIAPIEEAETAIFDGMEEFASKRGFIWARTIPLLKKHILLGSGADTFSIEFPQHDYVNFYNYGYGKQLISKPHCWYLQIGIQTGLVSLLAVLAFYAIYFIQSIRLYSKKIEDFYPAQVGMAIFVGTIAYMVAGVTNDSSITVAPVFWGILGLGVTVNIMVKKNRKENEDEQ